MDVTIDSSAIMAVVLNEKTKPEIVRATRDAELFAPHSLHWEVGNALSALFRRGRVDQEGARRALASYEEIPIQFVDVPLEEGVTVAHETGHYAYDAYMLECETRYNTSFLTLDRPLRETARGMGIELLEVGR